MVVVLELRRRRGPRAEERAAAAALHPGVVIDKAHQPREEPGGEQKREPGEPSAPALLERCLDGTDGVAQHVPEEEDENTGRGRGEEGLRRGGDVLHSAEWQADEDRQAGDSAEQKRLGRAHVRVTLQVTIRGMAQGHSVDEYLETIYFLAFPIGEYRPLGSGSPTLASRVAEMLGVSRASAGEMLKRLEGEGLIERGSRKEALLTEKGRIRAEQAVRKHRIIERLLTDFLGYTGAEAHVHADELGDTFSDDMMERIAEKLGHPDRCPHGWPVDPAFEQEENRHLAALSELQPGARATIVRLAEHDGDLLHWFYDEGLVPGREIEVREAQPAAGQMTVRLNGDERAIGEKAAAGLFVKPG